MAFAQWREPPLNALAKHVDRRHAERAGDVHRPAIIAHQQIALVDERDKLTQPDLRPYHALNRKELRTVPRWFGKGEYADPRLSD